jgi:hypothetical protein
VALGDAVGKGFVHADDEGSDGGIFRVRVEHALEPGELIAVELVGGCIVEIDEVDASALPVIVSAEATVFRVVP